MLALVSADLAFLRPLVSFAWWAVLRGRVMRGELAIAATAELDRGPAWRFLNVRRGLVIIVVILVVIVVPSAGDRGALNVGNRDGPETRLYRAAHPCGD
jgi:hypothetical protein